MTSPADQRERLLAAMIDVASRHGYSGSTVERVIDAAAVSRVTFYEHFPNREECFLEAYRAVVSRVRQRVQAARRRADIADRPRAVLEALLREVVEQPAAARLLLVEALGSGPTIRTEHETLVIEAELAIEQHLEEAASTGAPLQLPAIALLGGVAGILSMRVFDGRADELFDELDDLLAWIGSYDLLDGMERMSEAGWEALGANSFEPLSPAPSEPSLLPRGGSGPSAAEAAKSHRERILVATARLVARDGYASMSVASIAATARISRGAFYRQFRGKHDAFLAVQSAVLKSSAGDAAPEFFSARDWPDRVWNAVEALLSYVALHPDLAALELMETHVAGPEAVRQDYDSRLAYVLFLEEGYRWRSEAEILPRMCSEAIAGAIFALMRRQVVRQRTTEMLEVLPACAYVSLAPFIGPAEAQVFVESRLCESVEGSMSIGGRPFVQSGPG
jgi:AcrR family transcriptional regulator